MSVSIVTGVADWFILKHNVATPPPLGVVSFPPGTPSEARLVCPSWGSHRLPWLPQPLFYGWQAEALPADERRACGQAELQGKANPTTTGDRRSASWDS